MASSGPRVVVVWSGGTFTRPLPGRGALTIGRGHGCDIAVDHPSVSRRHALLHVSPSLRIEDCGSANGTRVAGRAIAAGTEVALAGTEVVEIGEALLTFQGVASSTARSPNVSGAMEEVDRLVSLVARGSISVILLGETGVGKEVTAERIHRASPRANRPLIRVNCAALSEHLLESELFGHERGAFTGALAAKPGLLEAADGGTMFLDEIGELPASMQAKLLRVLEARELTRVGGLKPRPIDVRFVSATNRELSPMCAARAFREDLYHRLNGITITIPPLRERRAEIAPLARAFVKDECEALGKGPLELGDDALARLESYGWPGNVRELRKAIERAVLLVSGATIRAEDLRLDAAPTSMPAPADARDTLDAPGAWGAPAGAADLRGELASVERARIVAALHEHGGNQTRAAMALGISRRTLVSRMEAYGLPRPRKSP